MNFPLLKSKRYRIARLVTIPPEFIASFLLVDFLFASWPGTAKIVAIATYFAFMFACSGFRFRFANKDSIKQETENT